VYKRQALNFGVRGAIGTAAWATALVVPHWLLVPQLTATHFWIELSFLVVLNTVAVVVGVRVEGEQRARQRAEAALRTARIAEARYHSLFEDQPAPVIITDSAGVVSEVNTAATRLLGTLVIGCRIDDLLGAPLAALLAGLPGCLELRDRDGEQVLLVPIARTLATDDGTGLVQVVLTDVTEQHRRQEEQRRFAGQLLTVQEEERRRLARELHDEPLQQLTYLARALEDLSQQPALPGELPDGLSRSAAVAAEAASSLRKQIHGLRPPVLDDLGLVSALRQLTDQACRRDGLVVDLQVEGHEQRLSPDVELTTYRIAQEALNNVLKHAQAHAAQVGLRYADQLTLTITDDGRGLQHGTGMPGRHGGLGLIGMRERVSMAGGTLEVRPHRPRGTLVRATLPLGPSSTESAAPPSPGLTARPVVPHG
jgi:signal transduction histidine kinase